MRRAPVPSAPRNTDTRLAGPAAASARGRPEGFGRGTSKPAEAASDFLRRGTGPELARRRRAVACTLGGAASMGVIALYQTGVIKHLPDPPLPFFDSDRVDASGEAYVAFETPDSLLAMASYGVTAALAAMGAGGRAEHRPLIPLAFAVKAVGDAIAAAALTVEQVSKHRALCFWCTTAAALSFAALPAAFGEGRDALRTLRKGAGP